MLKKYETFRRFGLHNSLCEQNSACAAATFWEYHYYYYWDHVCMGRTEVLNVLGPDTYADSGVRDMTDGDMGMPGHLKFLG